MNLLKIKFTQIASANNLLASIEKKDIFTNKL